MVSESDKQLTLQNASSIFLTRNDAPPSQLKLLRGLLQYHGVWWGTETTALNHGLQRRGLSQRQASAEDFNDFLPSMCGSKY